MIEIAKLLNVDVITLIGGENTYTLNSLNQQGGHAATQMIIEDGNKEKINIYERYIDELKEQVIFLRTLIKEK